MSSGREASRLQAAGLDGKFPDVFRQFGGTLVRRQQHAEAAGRKDEVRTRTEVGRAKAMLLIGVIRRVHWAPAADRPGAGQNPAMG